MTRLFANEDWSRFESPEQDAPWFLADSFDPLPFEPIRNVMTITSPDIEPHPATGTVYGVRGHQTFDSDDSRPSAPAPASETAQVPAPAQVPIPRAAPAAPAVSRDRFGFYSGWSSAGESSYRQDDERPDCGYGSAQTTQDRAWDPLTDPWPEDQRLAEPLLVEATAFESPVRQNLVYPQAGYSEAQYAETYPVESPPSVPAQARADRVSSPAVAASSPAPAAYGSGPATHPPGPAVEPPPRSSDPQEYDVVLTGSLGDVEIGFRDAKWYSLFNLSPRRLSTREVLAAHPQHAGAIVQVVCWWIREHPGSERALDLATELALAVSDFARAGTGVRRAVG